MPGHRPEQNEMQFLKETCTPEIYRRNAFRVTGLDVTISPKDAKRFAKEREQRHRLGIGQSTPTQSPFPLPAPPSDEDIRHAIDHRINHPYRRLVDELFWFWPKTETTTDTAFQSLQIGDQDAAKQIWLGDIKSGERNSNSLHNLAVIYHLTVLEMETACSPSRTTPFSCPYCKQNIDATPTMFGKDTDCQRCGKRLHIPQKKPLPPETETQITALWKSTYSCWTQLWINMEFWAEVATRAKQIDETITPDKIELLRQQLPEALLSINAQLAHVYCSAGMHTDAERQARTIWESKFSERHRQDAVRNSTKHTLTQLHAISAAAETRAHGNPEEGLKVVADLLAKTRPLLTSLRTLNLNDTLTLDHAARDAVANAAMIALVAYGNKTLDWPPLVQLNRDILELAHSDALKGKIGENLATIEENARGQRLRTKVAKHQTVIENKLANLETSTTLEERLTALQTTLIQHLESLSKTLELEPEVYNECADVVARYIRELSVSLYNKLNDIARSSEAIDLAISIARGDDIRQLLTKDKAHLTTLKAESTRRDTHLKLRNDLVEVTSELVKYRRRQIIVRDITGITFGIYKHSTNGIQDKCSYLIRMVSSRGENLSIECNRFLRSETKVEADFNAILKSVFYHVIPGLVTRLTEQIMSGHHVAIGAWTLENDGVHFTTGMLMWKKTHVLSWPDIHCVAYQGQLTIISKADDRIRSSQSLRETWNAVILEYIVKAIVDKKKPQ